MAAILCFLPFDYRLLKRSVIEWIRYSNVQFSSPHCITHYKSCWTFCVGSFMCAKLRTYKLLLLFRLSGAHLIIQMFYIYKLILYLLFTSHGTIASIDKVFIYFFVFLFTLPCCKHLPHTGIQL